jgi:hypothetical protein
MRYVCYTMELLDTAQATECRSFVLVDRAARIGRLATRNVTYASWGGVPVGNLDQGVPSFRLSRLTPISYKQQLNRHKELITINRTEFDDGYTYSYSFFLGMGIK